MQIWKKTVTKKALLDYFKARGEILSRRKKCPEECLITFGAYFDNNKVYLGTTVADYVLEHTETRDNQE